MGHPVLIERIVEAYGGAARWEAAERVEATVTVGGALFTVKRCTPRPRARYVVHVHEPYTRIDPIDGPGHVGVLHGHDVRLESRDGQVVEERSDVRHLFPLRGHRKFYWDALDLTYFLGYAFWNYLALPALLLRDDVGWTEVDDHVLQPAFPHHLPTHGADEQLRFDPETHLLTRFDYHPEVVTPQRFIKVANMVERRGTSADGIPYEAVRRVTNIDPVRKTVSKRPVMVRIDVEEWALR